MLSITGESDMGGNENYLYLTFNLNFELDLKKKRKKNITFFPVSGQTEIPNISLFVRSFCSLLDIKVD